MNHVARAAALGTAILIVALQLPAVVVATQLPRDVARQAFAAFWVGALAQYAVCGALLGAALLASGNVLYGAVGVLSFGLGIGVSFLEMLVMFLQAYVFTLLSAMYIGEALAEEH